MTCSWRSNQDKFAKTGIWANWKAVIKEEEMERRPLKGQTQHRVGGTEAEKLKMYTGTNRQLGVPGTPRVWVWEVRCEEMRKDKLEANCEKLYILGLVE